MLDQVTFIDSPGVLSGEKQRIQRGYDFTRVIEWFAGKSGQYWCVCVYVCVCVCVLC